MENGLLQCRGTPPDSAGRRPVFFFYGNRSLAKPAGVRSPTLTGTPRGDAYLCTNPLAGGATAAAAIKTNLGTLKSSADLASGEIIPGAAPARCDAKGYLLIGAGPDLGSYVLPGNNYHVYDYNLFWVNIRADVARRTKVFAAK